MNRTNLCEYLETPVRIGDEAIRFAATYPWETTVGVTATLIVFLWLALRGPKRPNKGESAEVGP